MEQWLVIGISGVTCSGKTTLSDSLFEYFKEQRRHELKAGVEVNRVELVNQDAFFRDVNDPNHIKIEKLNHFNWEILDSIDMDKMTSHLMGILGSGFVLYSSRSSTLVSTVQHENLFRNNFAHQTLLKPRLHHGPDELFLNDGDCATKLVKHKILLNILIIEGFLIFNHPVTFDLCNVKYHLHVPYEVCHARRVRRIYDPPDVPCYFEMVVWPSYEKHLREFRDREEIMFLNGDAAPEKCFKFVLNSLVAEL